MESAEVTENTAEMPAPDTEQKKNSTFNDIIEILETMLMSVFVVLLLFTYLIRPVTVEGRSMVPTLQNQDKLVMRRILYQPHQGDIVVVNNYEGHILSPDGSVVSSGYALNEILIKRIIAVSGQSVEVRADEGLVYVDGVALDESYTNEPTLTNDGAFSYPITVPEGYVFVMGDNRNHSTDSRNPSVGLIAEEDILGNAFFRYCAVETDGAGQESVSFSTVGFIS